MFRILAMLFRYVWPFLKELILNGRTPKQWLREYGVRVGLGVTWCVMAISAMTLWLDKAERDAVLKRTRTELAAERRQANQYVELLHKRDSTIASLKDQLSDKETALEQCQAKPITEQKAHTDAKPTIKRNRSKKKNESHSNATYDDFVEKLPGLWGKP